MYEPGSPAWKVDALTRRPETVPAGLPLEVKGVRFLPAQQPLLASVTYRNSNIISTGGDLTNQIWESGISLEKDSMIIMNKLISLNTVWLRRYSCKTDSIKGCYRAAADRMGWDREKDDLFTKRRRRRTRKEEEREKSWKLAQMDYLSYCKTVH